MDHKFRFPYCAAFFRPTDKLQSASQELRSSGEHIPVCMIDGLIKVGPRGGKNLEYEEIRRVSLNHLVFEDLFCNGKIGSRTLSMEELAELYDGILENGEGKLVVHAQQFSNS